MLLQLSNQAFRGCLPGQEHSPSLVTPGGADKASWTAGRGGVGCTLGGPCAPEAKTGGSLGSSRAKGHGWSRENILEGL